ncbi:MAG: hypothetical protein M1113_00020 [Candidatus Thermoplasmatota archaeon]|nr:hypothetical protein [Candidatus Thermoplasmatota archaeon]
MESGKIIEEKNIYVQKYPMGFSSKWGDYQCDNRKEKYFPFKGYQVTQKDEKIDNDF